MRPLLTAAVLFALVGSASAAPSPAGTYRFTGAVDGNFDGTLAILAGADKTSFTATAHEVRDRSELSWQGAATLAGQVLTIQRIDEGTTAGLTGALGGDHAPAGTASHLYIASFDAKFENATVLVYIVSTAGARTAAGTAKLTLDNGIFKQLPGEILGLGSDTLDKALHKELDLNKDFGLLNYAHVAVKVGAQILDDASLSPDQKASNQTFSASGKGTPVWIRTVMEGGPRVDFSRAFPIDPSGIFSVDFGFSVGTRVHYTCDEQYPEPKGLTDTKGILGLVEAVPAESFALPLSAELGDSLVPGSHRLLEGTGALAILGGFGVGYRLAELGIIDGHADVDLAASLGVTWALGGELQLEVTRESEHKIRVHWTRGYAKDFEASAALVIGLSLDQSARDKAAELLTHTNDTSSTQTNTAGKVVSAIVNDGQKYTQIKFSFGADWKNDDQLEVDIEYDLSNPKARTLYEAAVRGNVTASQILGVHGPESGVLACKVTSTLTDALATDTEFSVFNLLSYHHDTRTADVRVDVKTQDGTHSVTDMRSYDENTHHLFGGADSLEAIATDRRVEHPPAPVVEGQRVDFRATHTDDGTNGNDLAQDLRMAQLLFGDSISADVANLEAPGPRKDYGKTQLVLSVALGETAMGKVLSTDENSFYAAYARTFVGKAYSWTPQRVKYLASVSLSQKNDASFAEEQERIEAWDIREAKTIYSYVKKANKHPDDLAKRLQAFPGMAEENGYNMRAILTLATLGGGVNGGDVQASFSITGGGLNYSKSAGAVQPLPNQP
jgi:hypothetical protein